MTLHGHTKIELTDIHTGAVETILLEQSDI